MTATVTPIKPDEEPGEQPADWYGLTADEVCRRLEVDPAVGLSTAEVEARRARYGPNKLAEEAKEPGWKAFLRQYNDLMQLVLVGAAVVSIVALQEVSTGLAVFGITVLNAVMGLNQEGKAAESVAALRQMLIMTAFVRRDGQVVEIPAEELVPGDIVSYEAGAKVPADGRLLVAATLEIEEAGLTGESTPVAKVVDPVAGTDVPLGDRVDMAYMNSQVTRGRGEMVVTATGMDSEVGHISGMLSGVEQEKTPLTKQLDQLTVLITIMAAAALVLIVVLGLARGDDFDELFLVGISLAISAIPTGLPAVVTYLLSVGTRDLADKGAIVKRLRSVETLGSTSAICSDKTGTLTLNQMTARQLAIVGRRYNVDGEGYSTTGRILRVAGSSDASLEPFLLPMALANDAVIRDGACIGDPTEGALVVLAAKGGLDVEETRRVLPRVAEVPFDAEYKLMATFHEMDEGGRAVVRCFVKGAPDVLLARSSAYLGEEGASAPLGDEGRTQVLAENDRMAGEGLRVLALARKDVDPATFDPSADLLALVADLQLLALVGIVDPPRKEARDAIAECKEAGIRVRMITGDHATTAAAIAGQLGIEGRAMTGADFAALSDDELNAQVEEIGVVARVAPEDKVRLVSVLKGQGNIVAMTGDGVNDAPALTRADIGVAMGITGTEVTKDAAEMILTDDNFATIVTAVEGGRGLYDNLMKYVRVQMIMLAGFILTFVGAGIFSIANGTPLLPLQILYINFAVDVLLAIGLGFDAPSSGLMGRRPRSPDEPVINRALGARLAFAGLLISIGTLAVVSWGEDRYPLAIATTMGLVTTGLLHIAAALEWRNPERSVFTRETVANGRFNILVLAAFALTFLVTAIGPLGRVFDTVALNGDQWRACFVAVLGYVALAEIGKLLYNRFGPDRT
ncbi:MAG TPA: HAD-IC family P-type ATPase [Acidimicrobiales bacterium]|nr:HAD-IC family P-type ATPase [Acidimicrobiales bacterium]